jgi:hypothetical protein
MAPSKDEILYFLDFLVKKGSEKTIESYIAIKNALKIYSIPFPSVTLPKGKILYRVRIHKKGENLFENIGDLSHRLDLLNIDTFGRANEPLQSIFYCSDNSTVAFFEVSNISKAGKRPDSEISTIGYWQVQEDIRIGSIPLNGTIRGLNVTADGLQDDFEHLVAKFNQENIDITLKVLNIFSNEFTRNVHNNAFNYLISCAFANYVYDVPGFDTFLKREVIVAGILYPSVIHREEGMNISLKPFVIDEKKLVLVKAVRKVMIKESIDHYRDIALIESKKIDYIDGKIIW